MKTSTIVAFGLVVTVNANAQMSPNMAMPKQASAPATAASSVMTQGVIQTLDKSRGVVTLKHGEIANMGMPAMTMAFNVADKKMLENLNAGDNVRFRVENVNGAPTVIRIDAAK
jgi:Cu/Ag efflux protein CusF